MRLCSITPYELSRAHGTGAQLLALFDHSELTYEHLYWHDRYGGDSAAGSIRLEHDQSGVIVWNRCRRKLRTWAGREWWVKDQVNVQMLSRALGGQLERFDVAHVLVKHERDAVRAGSVVRALECPYIVHVMDLEHANGTDPQNMAGFASLLRGAYSALAVTPPIQRELAKFNACPVEFFPIGQPITEHVARPPSDGETVRIIMVGSPYAGGAALLQRAVGSLALSRRKVDLVYAGAHFNALPEELRRRTRWLGDFKGDDYRRVLASAHMAYLPGPCDMDCYGRFSFPSRCVDYLMAGLPIIAHVASESAAAQLLRPLVPGSIAIVRTPEELADAARGFTQSEASWQLASTKAREFAVKCFSIERLKGGLVEILQTAARGDRAARTVQEPDCARLAGVTS